MSEKLLLHRGALCNVVRRLSVEAGELVLEYFDGVRDNVVEEKADGSPVTVADQEAEKLIETALRDMFPDIPVIGEEAYASGTLSDIDLATHPYFWLVDPVDGTKAFMRGEEDFTVNIGLVHLGQPVLGVVYAPAKGEVYAGYTDDEAQGGASKALRYFEDSDTEKEMRTRAMPGHGLTVMSSHYHGGSQGQEALLHGLKVKKIIRRASSLKICAIANGKADIYPRFGPTCEWDTAAGHAVLRAAGGDIRDMDGTPLRYGVMRKGMLNPHFVAASGDIFDFVEAPYA